MAKKITAIRKYRPELKRMKTMQTEELMEQLVQRTALTQGAVRQSVYELRDTLLLALRAGQGVRIEGLGIFSPTIRADGRLGISFRADPRMARELNGGTLHAKILNKSSIGKSADELAARWNAEHPDDPVED